MTVTVFSYVPGPNPYSFQPTFDGTVYTCIIDWNLAGQRYYITCRTLAGALVFCRAFVASPIGYDISLTAGIFTTALIWRTQNGQIEVNSP